MAQEADGTAPNVDERATNCRFQIGCGGLVVRPGARGTSGVCASPPTARRLVCQRLVDQSQLIRLGAAKSRLNAARGELPKQLTQPPGTRKVERADSIRDNDNAAHSVEVDRRERSVDSGQLERAPLPGQV